MIKTVNFFGTEQRVLTGVLHSPEEQKDKSPAVIICHGFRGDKNGSGRAGELAETLCRMGMIVLRFDFSGTGESEGDFADITLSGYITDLTGAVDYAGSLTGGRIFVLGRSFGGTTAICQAAGDPRVAAVCAWAAPADLEETFLRPARPLLESNDEVFEIPGDGSPYLLKRGFFEDLCGYDVMAAAALVSPSPLFIVHGTADKTVPFTQGKQLYEAAREPKKKLFVKDGDHSFLVHYQLVKNETVKWLGNLANHWKK